MSIRHCGGERYSLNKEREFVRVGAYILHTNKVSAINTGFSGANLQLTIFVYNVSSGPQLTSVSFIDRLRSFSSCELLILQLDARLVCISTQSVGTRNTQNVACAVRTMPFDVYGCTSVAEATDGLERPFGTAISIIMAIKRAHGARYGFSTPNDLGSPNFYRTLLTQSVGTRKSTKMSI